MKFNNMLGDSGFPLPWNLYAQQHLHHTVFRANRFRFHHAATQNIIVSGIMFIMEAFD